MITYVIIGALSAVAYAIMRYVINIVRDDGAQQEIAKQEHAQINIIKKQSEIMVEAKTIEQVLTDLDSGTF